MWDTNHLLKNIKFTMIQELMGLGPMKYCIVYNKMPKFSKKLLLLISYLPHKKMCLYPYQTNFDILLIIHLGEKSGMQSLVEGFI